MSTQNATPSDDDYKKSVPNITAALYRISSLSDVDTLKVNDELLLSSDNDEMAHLYDDTPIPFIHGQITMYDKQEEDKEHHLDPHSHLHLDETQFDSPLPPTESPRSPRALLATCSICVKVRGKMEDIINEWIHNDSKYKHDLSKTEDILTKHGLSGKVLNELTINDIKQKIYNDLTVFMTSDTLNIMLHALNKWKTENKLWMTARSEHEIANKLYHVPITRLIAKINKETVDTLLHNNTIQLQTGWNVDECEQIKLVLLKHWIFAESQFIENMDQIFATHEGIKEISPVIMDQIKQTIVEFDLETLQFEIKNNKNIDYFSERIISLVDDLLANDTKHKYIESVAAIYHAISQCFVSVDNRVKHGYNHWICNNCGNYNWNQYMNNQMNTDLSICSLCGISQMDAITLSIRNHDTFLMVNEEESATKIVQDNDIKDDIDETIHDVIDEYKIDLICPNRSDDRICPSIYRLARNLIAFNIWLKKLDTFDVKSTTVVDIERFVDNMTFKNTFIDTVKSIKRVHAKEKESLLFNIKHNTQNISELNTYLKCTKQSFVNLIKDITPSIKRAAANKIYVNIKKSLQRTAQKHQFGEFVAGLDDKSIDNDYRHILKSHIHDGNKSTLSNVFRFFNVVVHYKDTENETTQCRSVQRRVEREKEMRSTSHHSHASVKQSANLSSCKDIWSLEQYYIQSELDTIHAYLVHSECQTMDKIRATAAADDEISDKFVSEFEFGVKYSHPQLCAQYHSIHDELIHNTFCPLRESTFQHLLMKAIKRHHATVHNEEYKIICKYYDKQYNIIRNEPIAMCHILAIILYTDISNFCKTYRDIDTYRRIGAESQAQLTKKHCQLYHCTRCLFEAVEFYGECMAHNFKVYHGLRAVLHFQHFTAEFNQPVSTTTNFAKAHQFSKGVGIILELQSALDDYDHDDIDPSNTPKHLSVSWLSQFPQQDEHLFYGSSVILKITNITEAETLEGHRHELIMLNIFQHMTQNKMVKFKDKMISALVLFIKHQQENKKEKIKRQNKSRYISEYGQALFITFCRHPKTTIIRIRDYVQNVPILLQNVLFKHKYPPINDDALKVNSKLVDTNNVDAISIIPLFKVFPYLKQIELTHVNLNVMISNAAYYVNVIYEYMDRIQHMSNIYLKRISFHSTPQPTKTSNKTLKELQTSHFAALAKHKWRFDYDISTHKQNAYIHCFTFINEDYDLEQEIKQLQIEQQIFEEQQSELERQTIREQQLKRINKKNTTNGRDISNLIPVTISRYMSYIAHNTGSYTLHPPHVWEFTTVIMVVNIAGFSQMTHFADKGGSGTEKLAFYLNRYWERLGHKVRNEGGDILKFERDVMIAIWPPNLQDDHLDEAQQNIQRAECIAHAVQAARDIHLGFHNAEIIKNQVILSVKIGIGYGPMRLLFIGGDSGECLRIEYISLGSGLQQAFNLIDGVHEATAGDVMISTEAYEYVKEKYVFAHPIYDKRIIHKIHNNETMIIQPVAYKVMLERQKYKKVRPKALLMNKELAMEHYRPFVPHAAWIRSVPRYMSWHSEQRVLSVLCVKSQFNQKHDMKVDSLLQNIMVTIQNCIHRYKGSLYKFLFDGEGSTVIAAFGLCPTTNFDDCCRAVLAALCIEREMKSVDIKTCISVVTGKMFVGVIGVCGFSQFEVLGTEINIARELLLDATKSAVDEGVIVTNTTRMEARDCECIAWQKLHNVSCASATTKDKEIAVWRPRWKNATMNKRMRNAFSIGWKDTMAAIKASLLASNRGHIVMIHAAHLGGSTHFARELMDEMQSEIGIITISHSAYNDDTMCGWKVLLVDILKECRILRGDINDNNRSTFMRALVRFMNDSNGKQYIPYLLVFNELLNVSFKSEEKEVEHELQIKNDDSTTNEIVLKFRVQIICHLLRHISKYSPIMIVISKLQYMSAEDYSITHAIANQIYNAKLKHVSLVLSGWRMNTKSLNYLRSPQELQIAEYVTKIKEMCSLECRLPKWTQQEVHEFLKSEFEVDQISKNVLHYILNKTDGVPGIIKYLVHDHRLLFLKRGSILDCPQIEGCRDIQTGSESDINLPIPYAIESYYTKMMDALDPFALLTLKLAAIMAVGQEFLSVSFSFDMLYWLHPLKDDCDFDTELLIALSLFERECFLNKFMLNQETQEMILLTDIEQYKDKHDEETFYVFCCGFLRDVVYGSIAYKARSVLHKQVKRMLDREPFNTDALVKQSIKRHSLLSVCDGMYSNIDEMEMKREQILGYEAAAKRVRNVELRLPECILIIYVKNVFGLTDNIKASFYISIHIKDDKSKALTQSISCHEEYMTVILSKDVLTAIEDEHLGPVLIVKLWFKQKYRVDQSIGGASLQLREMYQLQLSQQMSTDNQDLYVAHKMVLMLKQKSIQKWKLRDQMYINSLIRFSSIDK